MRQNIGQQAVLQIVVLVRHLVRLAGGQDTDALIIGQLAQPAAAHRPRLEVIGLNALRRETGVEHETHLAGFDRLQPRGDGESKKA